MKTRLNVIKGAIVAGLIGTAYATCYYQTSGICVSDDTTVDFIQIECPPIKPVKADGAWVNPWASENRDNHPVGYAETVSVPCHGPAYYLDCSGEPQELSDHTSPWYSQDDVDTGSTQCYP